MNGCQVRNEGAPAPPAHSEAAAIGGFGSNPVESDDREQQQSTTDEGGFGPDVEEQDVRSGAEQLSADGGQAASLEGGYSPDECAVSRGFDMWVISGFGMLVLVYVF